MNAEASVAKAEGKAEKSGDNVSFEISGSAGNGELGLEVNNVINAKTSGSLSDGTVKVGSEGVSADGKLKMGTAEVSNSVTQSSYSKSG